MEMSFAHRSPNGVIGHNALGSPIGARVVKMERGDGVAHLDGAYAKIDKSLTELTIKAAIGHTFIKTIDSQRVSAPARRVAAIERSPCRGQVVQDEGEERAVRELGHLERQRLPSLAQPLGIESVTRLHVSLRQGFAHKGRETEIAGGDEVTWPCGRFMSLNEITARDAILIREDEVIGCGRTQSHVQDDWFAKPMVRMPEVANWQEVAERIDHALSLCVRAVIGYDYLICRDRLPGVAPKRLLEPRRVIVCRDNYCCRQLLCLLLSGSVMSRTEGR